MRSYYKVTVKIEDMIEHKIESWSENNHSSVYSNGEPLFDGWKPEAHRAIENEIERLVKIAEQYGMKVEVVR